MLPFVALCLAAASALALEVNTPTESIMSSANVTISWTSEADDPNFNIFVYNQIFNDQYAIANNVNQSLHSITLTLPEIPPRDDYIYRFDNISGTNTYASSDNFTIEAFDASVASTTTFGSGASSTGSSASSSGQSASGASSTASGSDAESTDAPDGAVCAFGSAGAIGAFAGLLAWLAL